LDYNGPVFHSTDEPYLFYLAELFSSTKDKSHFQNNSGGKLHQTVKK